MRNKVLIYLLYVKKLQIDGMISAVNWCPFPKYLYFILDNYSFLTLAIQYMPWKPDLAGANPNKNFTAIIYGFSQ
jgi:hypothetical protein